MRKVLVRLGWSSPNFLTFQDLEGVKHNVLETGPKLMKSIIKRDWHTRLARHALRSFANPPPLLPVPFLACALRVGG